MTAPIVKIVTARFDLEDSHTSPSTNVPVGTKGCARPSPCRPPPCATR
ncbi:MAG: hypothetical protein R2749_02340 [Acidimicrobiales bacterium]